MAADVDVIEAIKARIFDLDCSEIRITANDPWDARPYNTFIKVGIRYYEVSSEIHIADEEQMHRIVAHFFLPNTSNGDLEGAQASLVTRGTFAYKEGVEERSGRIEVFYPPVMDALSVNMQLTSKHEMDLEDFVKSDACTLNIAAFIKLATMAGASILISGETDAGKTTLLSACLQEVPNVDPTGETPASTLDPEMVVVIQEFDEIPMRKMLYKQKFYSFEAAARTLGIERSASGMGAPGGTSDLVDIIKVVRGDRVVIGECRGGEMYDYLEAASIYSGSMTTLHAKSPQQAISNAVQFAMRNPNAAVAGLAGVRSLVAGGVDLVVHMAKINGRRVVAEIVELDGSMADDGAPRSSRLFVFNASTGSWDRPEGSGLSERPGRLLAKLTQAGLPNLHANPITEGAA